MKKDGELKNVKKRKEANIPSNVPNQVEYKISEEGRSIEKKIDSTSLKRDIDGNVKKEIEIARR